MVKWEFRATQMSISIPDLVAPFFFLFINFGYYYVSLNLYFYPQKIITKIIICEFGRFCLIYGTVIYLS